jgi:hypothetical protein
MRTGKWDTLTVILFDGVAPGAVSYYVSAALQGGAASVWRRALTPVTLVGMTVIYPGLLCSSWTFAGDIPWQSVLIGVVLDLVVAVPFALFWFATYGAPAGVALDRFAGRREM